MTKLDIGKNHVVIKDHAGYGPEGHDIVCAAISILAQTMAECLLEQEKKGGVSHVEMKLLPGDVEIRWEGEADCLPTIETGFALLLEHYPKNIKRFKERK